MQSHAWSEYGIWRGTVDRDGGQTKLKVRRLFFTAQFEFQLPRYARFNEPDPPRPEVSVAYKFQSGPFRSSDGKGLACQLGPHRRQRNGSQARKNIGADVPTGLHLHA